MGAEILTQPALGLLWRAALAMAVDQGVELGIGQLPAFTRTGQQPDGVIEIEQLGRQTPGVLPHLRTILLLQQLQPVPQGLAGPPCPFAELGHGFERLGGLRCDIRQLLADLPGLLELTRREAQLHFAAQRGHAFGIEQPPACQDFSGQVVPLAADTRLYRRFKQRTIGCVQDVQIGMHHGRCLFTLVRGKVCRKRLADIALPVIGTVNTGDHSAQQACGRSGFASGEVGRYRFAKPLLSPGLVSLSQVQVDLRGQARVVHRQGMAGKPGQLFEAKPFAHHAA